MTTKARKWFASNIYSQSFDNIHSLYQNQSRETFHREVTISTASASYRT